MTVFVIPLHFKQHLILIYAQPSLHHSGCAKRPPREVGFPEGILMVFVPAPPGKDQCHLKLTQKPACHCEEYWKYL